MERACEATGGPQSSADRDGEALPPSEARVTACCATSLAAVLSDESRAGLEGAGADTASSRRTCPPYPGCVVVHVTLPRCQLWRWSSLRRAYRLSRTVFASLSRKQCTCLACSRHFAGATSLVLMPHDRLLYAMLRQGSVRARCFCCALWNATRHRVA